MGAASSLSVLDVAIGATFAYGSVFGVVPTPKLGARWFLSDQKFTQSRILSRTKYWRKRLAVLPPVLSISHRTRHAQISSLYQALKLLESIPWVQAVWVTGSLAAENPKSDDDIDFLVLTAPNRLWLTRLVVLLGSLLLGHWRPRLAQTGPSIRQTWCWNIWLEPSAGLHSVTPSIYTAREIVQARLVLRRQGVSPTFLLDHALWVGEYSLAGSTWARARSAKVVPCFPTARSIWSPVFDAMNAWSFRLQTWYMQSHRTQESVERNQAWFHPGDLAKRVQSRYETMLTYWTQRMQKSLNFEWPADWTEQERTVLQAALSVVQAEQDTGKKLVLVSGVFDLLHAEHQNFLQKAAATGDLLLVVVESDSRVRSSKGAGRPHQSQQERLAQVLEFPGVTMAVVLPEAFSRPEHHRALLQWFQPAVLAVSSHSPFQDRKAALVAEVGGLLRVVHQHNPEVSTTRLLESIIKQEETQSAAG